jgi:hypothetical protein
VHDNVEIKTITKKFQNLRRNRRNIFLNYPAKTTINMKKGYIQIWM